MSGFYDQGALGQVAVNLFHGWGYNFYRLEIQLRTDDQLIRSMASGLLAQARAALEAAESAYRRERLPPPSRAQPFPDPAAVAGAQALERLGRAVTALEGQIRHQPVPENDRMTQLYREEARTLASLGECDKQLIGQADLLRATVTGLSGDAVLLRATEIEAGIAAIAETLRQRQDVMLTSR